MSEFNLDEAIASSTHAIGKINGVHYRLHENARVTWFIVLPETTQTEFFRLPAPQQQVLCEAVNVLSDFILQQFSCDKINIASIGNVVPQMHIHVVGRRFDDCYWPDVVWGQSYDQTYTQKQLDDIRQRFKKLIPGASAG
jgi:diadenosine tetraphosphate (Ap4A) HIT family hydrolase